MEESRSPGRKQASVWIDDEDYGELERIAKSKRSTVSQVLREYMAVGIERERRLQAVEV